MLIRDEDALDCAVTAPVSRTLAAELRDGEELVKEGESVRSKTEVLNLT